MIFDKKWSKAFLCWAYFIGASYTQAAQNTEKSTLCVKLVSYLEDLQEADCYWAKIERSPYKYFLNNTLTLGYGSWQNKIKNKRMFLKKEIYSVGELLGQLIVDTHENPELFKAGSTYTQHATQQTRYLKPSHLIRQFHKYALATLAVSSLYYAFKHYEVTPKSIESGMKNFYEVHVKRPLNEIKELATTDTSKSVVTSKESLEKNMSEFLEKLHSKSPEYVSFQVIIDNHLQGRSLSSINFEEKQIISNECFQYAIHKTSSLPKDMKDVIMSLPSITTDSMNEPTIPEKIKNIMYGTPEGKAVKDTLFTAQDMVQKLNAIKPLIAENSPYFHIISEGMSLQYEIIKFEILKIIKQVSITTTITTLIPAALVSYAGYKGTTKLLNLATHNFVGDYVRKDLLHFELHLNRYTTHISLQKLSSLYHGMNYYWLHRLKAYSNLLPGELQTSYAHYLEELENVDLTPEQKLRIIDIMFKEYDFLH